MTFTRTPKTQQLLVDLRERAEDPLIAQAVFRIEQLEAMAHRRKRRASKWRSKAERRSRGVPALKRQLERQGRYIEQLKLEIEFCSGSCRLPDKPSRGEAPG